MCTQRPVLRPLLLLALCLAGAPSARAQGTLPLISDGTPRVVVRLPETAHADERLAAEELVEHLRLMTGVTLTVTTRPPATRMPEIRIGPALSPAAEGRIRAVSDDPAAYLVAVDPTGVTLAGNTPEGTLFAAYELLEELGVRWYMPGELGRVVPRRTDVRLTSGAQVHAPSFPHRHLQAVSQDLRWYRRARLGGDYFPGAHGIHLLPEADFDTEPELFALIDGQRSERQLCLGHPEVLRRAVAAVEHYFEENPGAPWIGLGPNDGRGFCEDDRCRALDGGQWDPFAAHESMTDRHIWFFNQVLAGIDDRSPDGRYDDRRIAFYAYATYKLPPVRWTPDPRIVPALAPITLCRLHGMNNPVCPERSFYRELMRGWGEVVPEVFERGYYFNLADPGLPFSKVHAIRDETPAALDLGVAGWRVECMPSWAVHTPTLYVAARLMWDAGADVDALLAEFHGGFFGPAAGPMGDYLGALDDAFRDSDCHTGGSHCLRRIADDGDLAQWTTWFDEAQQRVGTSEPYSERVHLFRQGFERLRLFRRMLDERDTFDFSAAHATLQELYALTDTLRARELAEGAWALYPRNTRGYLERFWAPAVESGYRATVTEGRLVATLPDEWDFLLDPDGVGESLGYVRPTVAGGNWQRLRTHASSWGDQGLHYVKSKAWYRATFEIGELPADSVFVQVGGVDESARLWLNGEPLEPADGARAMRPYDVDATGHLRSGTNTLAVEVTNERLDELGTGGLTAPVFLWSKR